MEVNLDKLRSLECSVISPLKVLYFSTQSVDVRVGSLKILLHVLEVMLLLIGQVLLSFLFSHYLHDINFFKSFQRYGEKLHYSWPNILEMLRLAFICP